MEAGSLPVIIRWSLEEIRFYSCKVSNNVVSSNSTLKKKNISLGWYGLVD